MADSVTVTLPRDEAEALVVPPLGSTEEQHEARMRGRKAIRAALGDEQPSKPKVTVVVSGHPLNISVPPSWTITDLIQIAGMSAGVRIGDLSDWELRTKSGLSLDHSGLVADFKDLLSSGELFLDPRAGGGASR